MSTDITRELEARIRAHPLAAIAIAIAAGAVIALARSRPSHEAPARRTVRSAILSGLGAIALGLVKNAALDQLSGVAKSWLGPESVASRDHSVESSENPTLA